MLLPDSTFIVGGYAHPADHDQAALVHYSADGQQQLVFGGASLLIAAPRIPGMEEAFESIAAQPDSKLVAVGKDTVSRYLPDGKLDTTFGTTGQVAFVTDADARVVALQHGGRIVVLGEDFNRTPLSLTRFWP